MFKWTECVVAIELFLCRFTDQYVIAVILNTSYNVKLRVQHDAYLLLEKMWIYAYLLSFASLQTTNAVSTL